MPYDYHTLFGISSVAIGIISYAPYIRDIFRGTTKPHPFSWFLWGLLGAIVFAAQVVEKGGAGAWASGVTAFICFIIAALALWWGERKISKMDWFCLFGALSGIVLWQITSNPLLAVIMAAAVDLIAYIPTFVKAYHLPHEETLSTYTLSIFKWIFSLIALTSFSLTTALFPVAIALFNTAFVIMVIMRRR